MFELEESEPLTAQSPHWRMRLSVPCLMNGKGNQGFSPDCLAEYLEKSCNNPAWNNRPLSGANFPLHPHRL